MQAAGGAGGRKELGASAGANSSSRRQQQSVFWPIQLHSLLSPGPGGSAGLPIP